MLSKSNLDPWLWLKMIPMTQFCIFSSHQWHHDIPPCLSQGKKREFKFQQLKETYIEEPADITPFVDQLDEALKERVLQLQKGRWDTWLITCIMDILRSQLHKSHLCGSFFLSDTETHCEVMQEIVDLILEVSFAQGEYFELSFKHSWLFTHFFFHLSYFRRILTQSRCPL